MERKAPCLPPGLAVYAIGDIHGRLDALDRLLALIDEDRHAVRAEDVTLIFLGDYVDRGPDSPGVIDRLLEISARGVRTRFLLGNHEAALLAFLQDPSTGGAWLSYGGANTLLAYGVCWEDVNAADGNPECLERLSASLDRILPDEHRAFLVNLEWSVSIGDYHFVHAGVRPGVPLDRQDINDLLWIRVPFLESEAFHGKVVVHGHTIVSRPVFLPNRVAVDTGAFATGRLTAACFRGYEQRFLTATV
jgi:serine/threonine protein phosphatase 1